ncbi:MAG: PHP domain-containing protein [Firmicutes bacterium]|nr:PHP domain-containing protein [Bacillota bacterium]
MAFDLHTHTLYSDGISTPEELVKRAKEKGLTGVALTDHDTVDGLPAFLAAGRAYGLVCIPGVELSTELEGVEFHILGYQVDHTHAGLCERLKRVLVARRERARGILALLARHGLELEWEEIAGGKPNAFVGRFQIYQALKAKKLIGPDQDRKVFNYLLGTQGVAYLPHRELPSLEALALIRAAGGWPVLAPPGRLGDDRLIPVLVDHGLAGLEVYYPEHSPAVTAKYLAMARDFGLLVTGGSDYHGFPQERDLGDGQIDEEEAYLPFLWQ